MAAVRRFLLPPIFPDEERTRISALLHWMLLILAAVNLFDMLILIIFAPETLPTFWANLVFLAITALCFWMTRTGRAREAGYIVILSFWALLVWYVSISGGAASPAFGLFSVIVVIPAVLLRSREAVFFWLLSLASVGAIYWAGSSGYLIALESAATPSRLFATETAILLALILLMTISNRSIWTALNRARSGERALAARNRELQDEIVRRELAQQQEARLAAILEATSDLAALVDPQGRLIYMNRAGRRMTRLDADADVTGTVIADYHNPEVTDRVLHEAIPAAIQNGTWSGETSLLTRDLREIPVSQVVIAHRGQSGEVEFVSTVMRDISDRRQAEQQRLELARDEERLASFKDFLGTLSHDLKTPMTVALTSLELLQRQEDPQRRQEKIENIRVQIDLLNRYIQDLLLLTRLDRLPEQTFAPVDLLPLLRELETRLSPVAELQGVVLHVPLGKSLRPIWGDESDILRALVNLVENAIHYTPEGGTVTVTAHGSDDRIVVEVADTGIGIAPQDITHVFDRFYRSRKAVELRAGGTGLGLAIVKRIVEVHGGSIEVESVPGAGTTFRMSLPCVES